MNQTLENQMTEADLRETLLAVRAKLKIALHLARDRAERRISLRRVR
jgi:hypothetical protein